MLVRLQPPVPKDSRSAQLGGLNLLYHYGQGAGAGSKKWQRCQAFHALINCDGRMKLDRSTTAINAHMQAHDIICNHMKTNDNEKKKRNAPFLPPSSFPPTTPLLSPPYNPPKEKKKTTPLAHSREEKTKGSERMAGGAPRKWKSVSAMQKAIDAYFKKCEGEPFIGDDGCAV